MSPSTPEEIQKVKDELNQMFLDEDAAELEIVAAAEAILIAVAHQWTTNNLDIASDRLKKALTKFKEPHP